MSRGNTRLFQHLLICGLPSSFKQSLPSTASDVVVSAGIDNRPTVVGIWPQFGPLSPSDLNSVAMLAMPRGIRFFLSSQPASTIATGSFDGKKPPEPELHAFVVTREDYSRIYGASLTYFEPCINTETSGSTAKFVSKSICLCLSMMATQASFAVLMEIYRHISSNSKGCRLLPSLVDWLEVWLFDVVLPSPSAGPTLIRMPCGYVHNGAAHSVNWLTLSVPSMSFQPGELPFYDQSIAEVILLLGIENLLTAVSAAMLEHQLVLLAKEPRHLTLASEAIVTLLSPFEWQHVYAPIVPPSLQNFLEAPVPFIFGLLDEGGSKLTDRLPPEARICIIYVDSGLVRPPDDLPPLPWQDELAKELTWLVRQHRLTKLASLSGGSGLPSSTTSLEESSRSSSLDLDSCPATPSDEDEVGTLTEPLKTKAASHPLVAESMLQSAATLQRLGEIAKKAGIPQPPVLANKTPVSSTVSPSSSQNFMSPLERRSINELRFNAAVRELFIGSFAHLFKTYERFVLSDTSSGLSSDSACPADSSNITSRFDKAAFLSEQPSDFVPFLSRFLETQCFADFIANKIDARTENGRNYVRLLDNHIRQVVVDSGHPTADSRQVALRTAMSAAVINLEKAYIGSYSTVVSPPRVNETSEENHSPVSGSPTAYTVWPELTTEENERLSKTVSEENNDGSIFVFPPGPAAIENSLQSPTTADSGLLSPTGQTDGRPRVISISMPDSVDTSQLFVTRLIDECRLKAKKLLLARIGLEEARALGHGSSSSLEESGLIIVSLTDLLERIWAHGIADRACRSPLWSHLVLLCDRGGSLPSNGLRGSITSTQTQHNKPQFTSQSPPNESGELKFLKNIKDRIQRSDLSPARRPSSPLAPRVHVKSSSHLWEDVKFIQHLQDICSDTGRITAFVRLALERRRLADHLGELLSDNNLLAQLFRPEALLRQEEAREQLLAHLRSLGTVDLLCFTNSFPDMVLDYRVSIDADRKFTECPSLWLSIVGSIRSAGPIKLPAAQPKSDLNFTYANIGIPLCLRIGVGSPDEYEEQTGQMVAPPETFRLNWVNLLCVPTGHSFHFACWRRLGVREEPAAAEWLLLPETFPPGFLNNDGSRHRRDKEPPPAVSGELSAHDILEMLGNAVNALVKVAENARSPHGGSGRPSATILAPLLLSTHCGLAPCLIAALRHGTITKRGSVTLLAAKNTAHPYYSLSWLRGTVPSLATAMNDFEQTNCRLDRESKLILLLCRGLRDGVLIDWLGALTAAVADGRQPMLSRIYHPEAFLRNQTCVRSLTSLLASVQYYRLSIDPAIEQPLFSIIKRPSAEQAAE